MVIAFVESKSAAGAYTTSSWNFQGFHLSELIVSVDGIQALGNPVRMHFDSTGYSDTAEAYHWSIKTLGKWLSDEGNQMMPDDFA